MISSDIGLREIAQGKMPNGEEYKRQIVQLNKKQHCIKQFRGTVNGLS